MSKINMISRTKDLANQVLGTNRTGRNQQMMGRNIPGRGAPGGITSTAVAKDISPISALALTGVMGGVGGFHRGYIDQRLNPLITNHKETTALQVALTAKNEQAAIQIINHKTFDYQELVKRYEDMYSYSQNKCMVALDMAKKINANVFLDLVEEKTGNTKMDK